MSTEKKTYQRFELAQRIEHIVLIVSFSTLALTGLPQKYPLAGISQAIVAALGGIEMVRIIHRIAATLFFIEAIYHVIVLGYKLFVKRLEPSMLPGIKDLTDAFQVFFYNLGLSKKHPKLPRYNFAEKAEYYALIWGLVLMGLTGFMLWNPIATTRLLPGEFIPAAKAAHGGEAVLAVLAIILWHFYFVHLKRWNPAMFTGKLDHEAMAEEHALELEKIESGKQAEPLPPAVQRKRLLVFAPIAAVLSLASVLAIYQFISFEQSAITTLPESEWGAAFSPVTPTPLPTRAPTATPAQDASGGGAGPAAASTWEGGIADLFNAKCSACHGGTGGLSVTSYADLLKGGNKGPGFVAGDANGSIVVQTMQSAHPATFSAEELQIVIDWINAGAPEK